MSESVPTSTPTAVERVARWMGLIALVAALGAMFLRSQATHAPTTQSQSVRIDARRIDVAGEIARDVARAIVTRSHRPSSGLVATLVVLPSRATRAVLGAALDGGVPLRWIDSTGVRAMAVQTHIEVTPQPSVLIAAGASARANALTATTALTVRDIGGVIDSAHSRDPALSLRIARVRAPMRATFSVGGSVRSVATMRVPSAPRVRGVLLFAQPGWEAKFTTAALEESGWQVDGELSLAPQARMRIGTPTNADTSHYAAVIVLDSGVVSSRVLDAFLAQGGGVVIAGDALRDPALARVAGVRIVGQRNPIAGALLTDTPKRGLAEFQLVATSPAIDIEHEGAATTVFATRRGIGRVVASGYRAMWHWRMEGADASTADHRRWWNGLVGAVAAATDTSELSARTIATFDGLPGDAAPVADLLAQLGPAMRDDARIPRASRDFWPSAWLLIIIAMTALLTEWALRRLRGAP